MPKLLFGSSQRLAVSAGTNRVCFGMFLLQVSLNGTNNWQMGHLYNDEKI
jgi:hypothetical protein